MGLNPWQHYFDNNLNFEAFPYHSLMLYILSIFTYPIVLFDIDNSYIINFAFKLPLLLADITIFHILVRLYKQYYFKIILFYFINPIIVYSVYIHSQLDLIPIALLVCSLYWLIRKRFEMSAIFLGLTVAAKIDLFLAMLLLVVYIYKKYSIKEVVIYIAITSSIFLFFNLPYLLNNSFWNMIIANQKYSFLFDSYYNIGELKIYLSLCAVTFLLIHFSNKRKVSIDLLFSYFGVLFTAIIFFALPSPAYYIWIIPFISIYFINHNIYKSFLLYMFLSVFYLVFFIFIYANPYSDMIFMNDNINLKIYNDHLLNISFTLLESVLLTTLFIFYKYGIVSNSIYEKTTNMVIGIGGDSGSGKTSLLNNIRLLLGNNLLTLEGDGEHKWERGDVMWKYFTHLNPKANYIYSQTNAISTLKLNNSIMRSDYDHATGQFTTPIKISPKEFIILCGLHPYYLPAMRKNIDLKIYMDTDEKLKKHWKILRDKQKRAYAFKKIIEQIEKRVEDAKKYIYPQKRFADVLIRYFPLKEFDIGNSNANFKMGVEIAFDANIQIETILQQLDCDMEWDYNDDLQTQYIKFFKEPDVDFNLLALNNILNINEILDPDHQWLNGYRGLVQFIVLLALSEKMKGYS